MAICRRLVQLMDGQIGVESQPGAGSTFCFSIPAFGMMCSLEHLDFSTERPYAFDIAMIDRHLNETASCDASLGEHSPLRILVAEDNLVNQQLMLNFLEGLGYNPTLVGDGLAVLQLLEEQAFDLIFMDLQMPHMDGLEASRLISERYGSENRPRIIAITAFDLQEDRRKCLAAGMDDYLTKPVSIWQLELLLKHWAQWFQTRTGEFPQAPLVDTSELVMRLGTNSTHQHYMVALFEEEGAQLMTGIRQAVMDETVEPLLRDLHQLKGACLAMSVRSMHQAIIRLEQQVKRQGLEQIAPGIAQLETEWNLSLMALKQATGS